MEQLKEFMTASQAAKLSGYNPDYISSLIRSGKIGGKKVGKNWVTSLSEIQRYCRQAGQPLKIDLPRRALSPRIKALAILLGIAGFVTLVTYGGYTVAYQSGYEEANVASSSSQTAAAFASTVEGQTQATLSGNTLTVVPAP